MPYIKQDRRDAIFGDSLKDYDSAIGNAGELNFFITSVLQQYLDTKGESYQTYNDIMGVLEGAKMEIYRRKVAVYEDLKIKENGDVY